MPAASSRSSIAKRGTFEARDRLGRVCIRIETAIKWVRRPRLRICNTSHTILLLFRPQSQCYAPLLSNTCKTIHHNLKLRR